MSINLLLAREFRVTPHREMADPVPFILSPFPQGKGKKKFAYHKRPVKRSLQSTSSFIYHAL